MQPKHAAMERRKSSLHYQTFPSLHPPRSKGKPPRKLSEDNSNAAANETPDHHHHRRSASLSSSASGASTTGSATEDQATPLPTKQLLVLALISLCEQMAYNSIAPYLPEMVGKFPDVKPEHIGLNVGVIASSFSAAQFVTNVLWGNLSDRIGRKPVILTGTLLTAISFTLFGLTQKMWQAAVVQAVMGAVNGNQGVVSTILGEITDRSNQTAFAYLPIIYGIGAIVGPILGGVLVNLDLGEDSIFTKWPYLLPNILASVFLCLDWLVVLVFLEESLEGAEDKKSFKFKVKNIFSWLWRFRSGSLGRLFRSSDGNHFANGSEGRRFTFESQRSPLLADQNRQNRVESANDDDDEYDSGDQSPGGTRSPTSPRPSMQMSNRRKKSFLDRQPSIRRFKKILTPSIGFLLATFMVFNFGIVAYNSLYPIFASAPTPTGRDLNPKEIGLSLALGGLVSILFQAFCFNWIQERLGNIRGFRLALLVFAITFWLMPFVSNKGDASKAFTWFQIAAILSVKVVASVMALTCAMLLITNCAPTSSTLGTLNGIAQSLSAAGRAFGPFLSGGIFTLATKIKHGDMLVWWIFGGIGLCGFALSFGIRKDIENGGVGRRNEDDNTA